MSKAALWLRVSTDEQHVEAQESQLRAWADRLELQVGPVYRLTGASASKGQQDPALGQMLDDAAFGDFNTLLVVSLDRLERRGIRETLNLLQRLTHAGISVRSLNEPWVDTAGPMRELFISMFAWFAEWETRRRTERSIAGQRQAKAAGKHVGRPKGSKDKKPRRRAGYYRENERRASAGVAPFRPQPKKG